MHDHRHINYATDKRHSHRGRTDAHLRAGGEHLVPRQARPHLPARWRVEPHVRRWVRASFLGVECFGEIVF